MSKNYILDKHQANSKLQRLALEVAENLEGENTPLIIIGIRNSGMVIAEKIGSFLKDYLPMPTQIISMSFDKHLPREIELGDMVDFNDKNILIVDDVTNSGKTLLYALKPLLNQHPKRIQTLVLVERMHKLFPVKPDYVGLSVATTLQDMIVVEVEHNEVKGAYIN
ncbi:MAG: phosphoribosyltransferase [Sphingobacteriia bacterium]|nr:phosphoribosyltransferase [Sphingobacteriia bacterium]